MKCYRCKKRINPRKDTHHYTMYRKRPDGPNHKLVWCNVCSTNHQKEIDTYIDLLSIW